MSFSDGARLAHADNLRILGSFGGRWQSLETFIFGALQYQWSNIAFGDADEVRGLVFHQMSLRLAASRKLTARWRLNVFVTGGLASDFHDVTGDALRLTAGASLLYARSPRLRLQMGLMYSVAFFRPLVLPLLAVAYREPPWFLDFKIPSGGYLWYDVTGSLQAGVHLKLVNMRYQIGDPQSPFDEITVLNVPAGLSLRPFFWRGLFGLAEGGYNFQFGRTIRGSTVQTEYLWGGWQVSLGLGYLL